MATACYFCSLLTLAWACVAACLTSLSSACMLPLQITVGIHTGFIAKFLQFQHEVQQEFFSCQHFECCNLHQGMEMQYKNTVKCYNTERLINRQSLDRVSITKQIVLVLLCLAPVLDPQLRLRFSFAFRFASVS